MSDYETRVGKIKKITPEDGWSTIDMIRWVITDRALKIPDYYDEKSDEDLKEFFRCELGDTFPIINDVLYEVVEDKNLDDYDLFEASENKDGTIDYTLRYYNGGCGFEEALETAIDKMNT